MEKYMPAAEPLEYDNEDLYNRYKEAEKTVNSLNSEYNLKEERNYTYNYLKYYINKLAYCFAKEEKYALYNELLRRGLIAE